MMLFLLYRRYAKGCFFVSRTSEEGFERSEAKRPVDGLQAVTEGCTGTKAEKA